MVSRSVLIESMGTARKPSSVEQVKDIDVDKCLFADLFFPGFHAEDHASEFVGRFEFDSLAADLLQKLGQGGIGRQIDGKGFQRFGDRIFRTVIDRGYPTAVEILHHHALSKSLI